MLFPVSIPASSFNRRLILEQVRQKQHWDLLVIGGGATGLGVALDASSRGYSVLLLEQADFAKGTSSRSTKLIHGGVRYLAQGNLQLVREASIERGLLLQNAPHLVRNMKFVVPVYHWYDKWKYAIGLKLYDWIAGRLSPGRSRVVSRDELLQKHSGIREKGLKGGIEYHDGQFDDARLAINLAQTIVEQGGHVLNYMRVTALTHDKAGRTSGLQAEDVETGETFWFKARAVVNATGVFADNILQMDQPGAPPAVTASQGVHLVLDRSFYASDDALMIPRTDDGRVLFLVPWHQKVIAGTTDTPVSDTLIEPVALEKEIEFILNTASRYLEKTPQRQDVLSVFAGLRPLAAPKTDHQKTKEISRSHKILVSKSRLFTMLGGKWTTYRKMGEDMVNRIEKELRWPRVESPAKTLAVHAAKQVADWLDPFYFYGEDAAALRGSMPHCTEGWLSPRLQIHAAQVYWAVEHEMARTVEDILSRRTRCLLIDARESVRIAPQIARIMANALQRDEKWQQQQLEDFYQIARNYIL